MNEILSPSPCEAFKPMIAAAASAPVQSAPKYIEPRWLRVRRESGTRISQLSPST